MPIGKADGTILYSYEDTQKMTETRRYIIRFYVTEDIWFEGPSPVSLKDLEFCRNVIENGEPQKVLWSMYYHGNKDRQCVVTANKIVWWESIDASPSDEEVFGALEVEEGHVEARAKLFANRKM